jgi:hypothetical protein
MRQLGVRTGILKNPTLTHGAQRGSGSGWKPTIHPVGTLVGRANGVSGVYS